MRHMLVRSYLGLESLLKGSLKKRFSRRPVKLSAFCPIYETAAFTQGPIILVNGALASGGVERQIVNTLRVLGSRNDFSVGLLCKLLGTSPELDFFKPALADFHGFVRNAMPLAEAEFALRSVVPKSKYARITNSVAWMPSDVQEEILRFAAEFVKLKPRVVHAWQDNVGISATYAARIVGVPRILISTRNLRPTNFIWYRPYMEFAYREIADCRRVTMINNSAAGAKDYAQWLQIPVTRFVVKRNGLDMTTMKRSTGDVVAHMRAQLKIPESAAVVGSIFRFYDEKRPFLWVKVAREIARHRPETHFVVFGEGILLKEAVAMARDVGIGKQFHAPGNINDVPVGLSLFDVFLLTSQFEGTPNVVLEASSLGVPVVSTDAGGTAEAIEQGVTGFLVDSADPKVIASRTIDILSDSSWRSKVAREGPAFVERRFGLSRMVAETLQLYKIPHA
jgi:glycosyltransferase involved in cell wall biosynthesis